MVNAFAIGAEDESLWEIEALDQEGGAVARQFAIVYGEVPEGFVQNHPRNDASAKPLVPGRTYFVGATGPGGEVFRTVFALPVGPIGRPLGRGRAPDRKRMNSPQALPEKSKPADPGASSAP
ncbi:MAG TPA: hypothetical protein VNT79_13590 [Phycisphaerae bacterium]|nr:hypothetical protein [Phycisphaerae bacterium]